MALRITPLHPLIGARAEGVDLRRPLSSEEAANVEAAMDKHAVLVFPGQDIDDNQQMAFGQNFGPLEQTRATVDVGKQRLDHIGFLLDAPEAVDLSKESEKTHISMPYK